MIQYFKKEGRELVELQKPESNCWISIYPPFDHQGLKELSDQLDIPIDYFEDSLDVDERPRFEEEDGVKLIVIKTPILNEIDDLSEAKYITIPIGIILTDDYIITITSYKNLVIRRFLENLVKGFDPSEREMFTLKLLERNVMNYIHDLNDISNLITESEKDFYTSVTNEDIGELLNLQKSLVYFSTNLRTHEVLMMKMQRTDFLKIRAKEREADLMEDVIIENSQALEMANIYTSILNGTMDTFASIISNNQNKVLKRLTAVTIVLMIPTLVASLYGMNVQLPLSNDSNAFLWTLVIGVALSVFVVLWFRKIKWF